MDRVRSYGSSKKDKFNRQPATENRGQKYQNVLCFPSVKAIDIHQGFENGILTKKTNIIAVEKKKDRRRRMIRQLTKRTNKFQIVGTEAFSVRLDKYLDGEKIDYMPYDICGNFTAQLAGWFFRNQKHFDDGMRMPITLSAINRHQELFDQVKIVTAGRYVEVVEKALYGAIESSSACGWGFFAMSQEMKDSIACQIYMLIHSMPSKNIEIVGVNLYRNSDKSAQAAYMVMLDTYIHDCELDIRKYNIFNRIIDSYNPLVAESSQTRLTPKKKRAKRVEVYPIFKTAYEIGRYMGLLNSDNQPIGEWDDYSDQKIYWITINANKIGIDGNEARRKIAKKFGVAA